MNTSSLTTNSEWLAEASNRLKAKNIKSARLDSLVILEEVTKYPRIKLISQTNVKLSSKQVGELNSLLERRLKDEPMAYIRGHVEFYGRDFIVDSNVLVPRPESEAFINIMKSLNVKDLSVADIGTGSGCLGVTLKLEIPSLKVDLFDVSIDSLEVAEQNIKKFNLDILCTKSNLLTNIKEDYDVILTNLPYLPDIMKEINNLSFEPSISLFSGSDGMDLYKLFWQQIGELKPNPRYVLCESLENQHKQMSTLALSVGYKTVKSESLIQLFSPV